MKKIAGAMAVEAKRQVAGLKMPHYPSPYLVSYNLRDEESWRIWGRMGSINVDNYKHSRKAFCDVRVGNYAFDQVADGGLYDNDDDAESKGYIGMPLTTDTDSLRYHLWKLSDMRYREALSAYLDKRSNLVKMRKRDHIKSFKKRRAISDLRRLSMTALDQDYWTTYVNRASRVIKTYPDVVHSNVDFYKSRRQRVFVDSTGHQVTEGFETFELSAFVWRLTPTGEQISQRVSYMELDESRLPNLRTFIAAIKLAIKRLMVLATAPVVRSYAGPVLLAPGPAGILFHEVIGHRLEGSRLLSSDEGQTFANNLGERILPTGISIIDDPTLRESDGTALAGSYTYDDEGTRASPVTLVRNGVLKNFLSTRSPLPHKQPHASGGHARAVRANRPISRMANLHISSTDGLAHRELMNTFVNEIKRSNKDYGILVLDAEGGETATDSYDFQAFMGEVSLAAQVWKDGSINLIRNINFVGTPLSVINEFVATGDTLFRQNSYCGAESGMIPVSTTSPALLLRNLELQSQDQSRYKAYILPMPHHKKA